MSSIIRVPSEAGGDPGDEYNPGFADVQVTRRNADARLTGRQPHRRC